MSVVDSSMTREVLRDISKRPIDISALQVHVTHGVINLSGRIDKIRGVTDFDLEQEVHMIIKILKQKPGIRDVVCEVEIAGPSIMDRMRPHFTKHIYR